MSNLPIRSGSAWNATQLQAYLDETRNPLRIGLVHSGEPRIVPLWFDFREGAFWCACQRDAFVVRTIGAGATCGFDVSDNTMPYKGVRGAGEASIHEDAGAAVLNRLVERYLEDSQSSFARWLLGRAEDEVAIAIRPDWLTAWDFSERMDQ